MTFIKSTLVVGLSLLTLSGNLLADDSCTADIEKVISNISGESKVIKIKGQYTQKSQNGAYKDCSIGLKLEGDNLSPIFTHEEYNPTYGDGGAFWPFGSYPTKTRPTDQYNRLISFQCGTSDESFFIDYMYKSRSGWRKSSRYTLKLEKNNDSSYSVSLRAGNGSLRDPLVTCRGDLVK